MSHLLPYLIAGGGVAIVIAAFGAWMAWADLVEEATYTCDKKP